DRPVLQALAEPAPHEREHVMPPVLLVLRRPFRERLLERGEAEEEVLRLLRNRGGPVDPAPRVLELERIQDVPAVLALVATGPGVPPNGQPSIPVRPRDGRDEKRRAERRDRVAEVSRPGRLRPGDAAEDLRHARWVQERRLIYTIRGPGVAPMQCGWNWS